MPSEKQVIALRLDDKTTAIIQKLATSEMRSTANMAELLLRAGMRDHLARLQRTKTARGNK